MKWLRYCLVVAAFIVFAPAANAGLDPIGWSLSGTLPAETIVNETYPGFTYTFTNNLPFTMPTPLYIVKKFAGEFIAVDDCSGLKLVPKQTCTVTIGTFAPLSPGSKSVELVMEYGSNVVPVPKLVTETVELKTPLISGFFIIPLPPQIGTGTPTQVVFEFINNGNGTVNNVTYTPNYPASFVQVTNTCPSSPVSFGPGASCSVSGTLNAGPTPGTYTVGGTLNYTGGTTVLTTSTQASVKVVGSVPTPLPTTIGTGAPVPVVFQFTNEGNGAIIGTPDISASAAVTIGNGTFTLTGDNCSGQPAIPAGGSCQLTGTFQTDLPGANTITATFNYDGGTVSVITQTTAGITVKGTTPTPLPTPNFGTGSSYPIVFQFTNTGQQTVLGPPATTSVVVSPGVGVFTPVSDGCVGITQIAPNGFCQITGMFQTDTADTETITATFTYAGGPVTAVTTSTAIIKVTPSVTEGLPQPNFGAGSTYPFTFTFTNSATEAANGISVADAVVLSGLGNILSQSTNCIGSLGAGASCTVSGFFEADNIGSSPPPTVIQATFTYDGGSVTTSTTSTPALLVTASGSTLPDPVVTGTSYPFTFTFTNTATETANDINPIPSAAVTQGPGTVTGLTTTCGTSLAANTACTLSGTYMTMTPSPPNVIITGTFTYAGGTVTGTITSTAAQLVVASVPMQLPPTISTGVAYQFEFMFTNTDTQPATGITVATAALLSGTGTVSNVTTDCSGSLAADGGFCTISGQFIATAPSPPNDVIQATFTYAGGTLQPTTTSMASALVTVSVSGALPPSPIGTGTTYPFAFTYTNTSATQPATNISTPTAALSGSGTLTNVSSTCGTILNPGAQCTLSGNLNTSSTEDTETITATFTYIGGTVTDTTSGMTQELITGTASGLQPPPASLTAGAIYPIVVTFTNPAQAVKPANGPITTSLSAEGGTFAITSDGCSGPGPFPIGTCTIMGNYTAAPGANSFIATLTYAGGTTAPAITSGIAGSTMVDGTLTTPLPNPAPSGMPNNFTITFTNNGTVEAVGVTPPTYTYGGSGPPTDFTPPTTSAPCNETTLAPGASCVVMGTLIPSAPGLTYSFTAQFNYANGNPSVTTTTTSSFAPTSLTGTVTSPFPPAIGTGKPGTPFKFTLRNGTQKKVENITAPVITVKPASGLYTLDNSATSCGSAIKSLASGASCTISGNFIAPTTGDYQVDVVFNYEDKSIALNTKTNAGRVFTINNHCQHDIWFSFNGAEMKKGCIKDEDCSTGALCAAKADLGKGICYYVNPLPANKELKLVKGANTKVIVPDLNKSTTLWSGSLAGRTGCMGALCDTADCNSGGGNKVCPPGTPFALPATQAKFTLLRTDKDTYHIETMNGVNLPISIGPTTAITNSNNPSICATAGDRCTWKFTVPSVDYVWVKATKGKPTVCTSNLDCRVTSDVCGLSYSSDQKPTFQRICGPQLGYWTAKQACELHATDADYYFGCSKADVDNACVSVNGTKHSCYSESVLTTALNTLTWLKSACPTATTYAGDTKDSTFSCNTPTSGTNTTNYTVIFCPAS